MSDVWGGMPASMALGLPLRGGCSWEAWLCLIQLVIRDGVIAICESESLDCELSLQIVISF